MTRKSVDASEVKLRLLLAYGIEYEYWTWRDFDRKRLPKVPWDPSGDRETWDNFSSRSQLQAWARKNIDAIVSNTMLTKIKKFDGSIGAWEMHTYPAIFLACFFPQNEMVRLLKGRI